ncbi:MAG: hypothetical protein JSS72_01890 [Armatimonadetes bacterium]|nr:hypothetical protein [Armatimonadota bacterium]
MPVETLAAARWLYNVLTTDSQLAALCGSRVFQYRVPASEAFPVVVFQMQAASLDLRADNRRVASKASYACKAIRKGNDFVSLAPIARRIDALLEMQSGTNQDGVVATCTRDFPLEYLERTDEGDDYAHLGGVYRLLIVGA